VERGFATGVWRRGAFHRRGENARHASRLKHRQANHGGRVVAWRGDCTPGGVGHRLGPAPRADTVMAMRKPMRGATGTRGEKDRAGLPTTGPLAFFARRADGGQAIVRPEPVPQGPAPGSSSPPEASACSAPASGAGSSGRRRASAARASYTALGRSVGWLVGSLTASQLRTRSTGGQRVRRG